LNTTLLQRLDRLARNLVPFALCAVLVVFSSLPFHIPGYGQVAANFTLMSVFYWAVFRPRLMPLAAVFAIGVLQDIVVGTPLGTNALVLVLVHTLVTRQGRVFRGKSFFVLWWGFGMVALGAGALGWAVITALSLAAIDPTPGFFQFSLTAALFPFPAWLFARTDQAVMREA
jgi:rod shape-determining protein MreD